MKKIFKIMFSICLAFVILSAVPFSVSAMNSNSCNVGIIGGADGPTAIFLTSTLIFHHPFFWVLCLVMVLLIISAIAFFIAKRK